MALSATPVPRVVGLLGNDLPHASLGMRGISRITRNQMNMHMKNTLPRGRTDIYAYVVAIGLEFFIQDQALLSQ